MKKLFFVLLLGILGTTPILAQSNFSIQYPMGFGTSDVKSYISTPSFRGFAMEYHYMIQPQVSVGLDASWSVFYERRAYDTYTSGSVSLSGTQYRHINAVPIYFNFDYYLKPDEHLNPFFGLGVGTLYTKRNTDMGLYTVETDTWAFALRPELGVLVNANPGLDVILAGKYNYGFSNSEMTSQSYFTFNIGLVFKGR